MVPEGWTVHKLADLVQTNRPISYGIVQTGESVGGGVPCIRVVDLVKSRIRKEELITTTQEISNSYRRTILQVGDIMFALRGDIGHVVMADTSLVGANLTRGVALIAANEKVWPSFLLWAIRSQVVRAEIFLRVNGSALQEIPLGELRQIKIPVPSIAEQKKIAEILGSVDEAIAATQAVIDQTRKVKQGLLQQLLTRGIGHTKFKETAIGLIPESWEVKTIKDVVKKQPNALTAGPFGTIFKAKDFRAQGVPIVQIRHVTEEGFSWGNKTTYMDEDVYSQLHQPYTVRGGDLLITKMGEPPGIACIYPIKESFGMVTPDVIKATIDPNKADTYFTMCLYNSPPIKKRILELTKGGTRARITLDEFYRIPLPIPPLEEQIEISAIISELDEEIQLETKKLEICEEVKQGLMQNLLTGRVRVGAVA